MPQYLTLYTPAKPGQVPTKEHIEKMGAFMGEMAGAGIVIGGGGLRRREIGALNATLANGAFTVTDGEKAALDWMAANGFAILNVRSREHLLEVTRRFLELAGDGTSEIIELMDGPPPTAD